MTASTDFTSPVTSPPISDVVIDARRLTKRFQGMTAVSEMSLIVRRQEMVGLIGPNGAGKTTMFNLIAGSLQPTSGELWISGREVSARPRKSASAMGWRGPSRSRSHLRK